MKLVLESARTWEFLVSVLVLPLWFLDWVLGYAVDPWPVCRPGAVRSSGRRVGWYGGWRTANESVKPQCWQLPPLGRAQQQSSGLLGTGGAQKSQRASGTGSHVLLLGTCQHMPPALCPTYSSKSPWWQRRMNTDIPQRSGYMGRVEARSWKRLRNLE